jgi:hypothetical protein
MALPKVRLLGKMVILLSGFDQCAADADQPLSAIVMDKDKLRRAAALNPDAVAFGYVAGEWFAAA